MFRHKANSRRALTAILSFTSAVAVLICAGISIAQTEPSSTPEQTYNGYTVAATAEMGWRWRSVDGNENKYKSDLNYEDGFRFFDSNLFMQKENGRWFDSLLIMNSGWGSDPTGYFRLNMEKVGFYKLNVSTRRFNYFNNLSNFVAINGASQHTQNLKHDLTDIDFSLFPQNEKLRLTLGGSFGETDGDGLWTARGYRDDFPVPNTTKYTSRDFRIGLEGKLAGFNWGLNHGFRRFNDGSSYLLGGPHPGNNTADTTVYGAFSKVFPTEGITNFSQFYFNRTFAKKFDVTGRAIYTSTRSESNIVETFTASRDNQNNFVDLDQFTINSKAKRPQSRFDIGFTYRITDDFRISNTTLYDRFTVNGGEDLLEKFNFRNAANTTATYRTISSYAYRVNDFDRLSNLLEADYQFGNRFSVHAGWRHTRREVNVYGREGSTTTNIIVPAPSVSPTPSVSSAIIGEHEENSTNTFLAGFKLKPTKGWVIFGDVEHGTSDNVFTRVENYDFTNFRVRSRWSYKTVTVNVSGMTKDNTNPSVTLDNPGLPFGTDVQTRTFSGDVEWNPNDKFRVSGGYTKRNLTAKTPIYTWIGLVPSSGIRTLGLSEFYVRDNYAFVEVSAKPHRRVSFFATYRANTDDGQGDRISPPPNNSPNIVASYPMTFNTPEVRVAIRLTRNVDWNVGYQYYNYKDVQAPDQNYKAHLPYTSLRFYFGGRAADR